MTVIRRQTGEPVVVPNSELFKNPVQILIHQTNRRVSMVTAIAYGEYVAGEVEVAGKAMGGFESVCADRPVQIFPQGFGPGSIDIEVTWWTGAKPVDLRQSRGELVTAIKSALDRSGIEIPYPYRTLVFKTPLAIDSSDRSSPGW